MKLPTFVSAAIGTVRFFCEIPFYGAIYAMRYYEAASTLDGFYDSPPHGPVFLKGLAIAGYMSCIIHFWNIFVCVMMASTLADKAIAMLVVGGLVDLVLGAVLIAGVVMESRYLPTNLESCRDAVNWRPNASGESFFKAVQSSPDFVNGPGPDAICQNMVKTWALQVAAVGLLFIIGLLNIRVGMSKVQLDWLSRGRSQGQNGLQQPCAAADSEATLVKVEARGEQPSNSTRDLGEEYRIGNQV